MWPATENVRLADRRGPSAVFMEAVFARIMPNLEGTWRLRHNRAYVPDSRVTGERGGSCNRPAGSDGHNPFVLVNYSPTICLNPPLLIVRRVMSWPTCGRSREEIRWWARAIPNLQSPSPALAEPTRRTAVGLILGAPLLGACAGVQQQPEPVFQPVQFAADRARRTGAAAARLPATARSRSD